MIAAASTCLHGRREVPGLATGSRPSSSPRRSLLPPLVRAWREASDHVIPLPRLPPEVRRVIYTTNAIEALNRQLRTAAKTKGEFPSETPRN
jgi:transposase-like protein